jgi:hypothetical protein
VLPSKLIHLPQMVVKLHFARHQLEYFILIYLELRLASPLESSHNRINCK